ncbi:MAG TPA: transglycosylase family protein [Solirubrobacteraceae bacterium]
MLRRLGLPALACLALVAVLAPAGDAQDSGTLQRDIAAKQEREARLGSQAERLGRLERRAAAQLALLQRRLNEAEAELARARQRLAATQADLRAERARALRLRLRLAQARKTLANLLVERYQTGKPDMVTVVLNADGFADLLERVTFLKRVQDRDTAIVNEVRDARGEAKREARRLARLERVRRVVNVRVQQRRNQISSVTQAMAARRAALAQARAARLALRRATRASRRRAQRTLDKLLEQQRRALYSPGPGGPWAIPWPIVQCESGGQNLPPNWAGASGYYQFIPSTWRGMGGSTPHAYQASKAEQDRLAAKLWNGGRGARNWDCAAIVGLL